MLSTRNDRLDTLKIGPNDFFNPVDIQIETDFCVNPRVYSSTLATFRYVMFNCMCLSLCMCLTRSKRTSREKKSKNMFLKSPAEWQKGCYSAVDVSVKCVWYSFILFFRGYVTPIVLRLDYPVDRTSLENHLIVNFLSRTYIVLFQHSHIVCLRRSYFHDHFLFSIIYNRSDNLSTTNRFHCALLLFGCCIALY